MSRYMTNTKKSTRQSSIVRLQMPSNRRLSTIWGSTRLVGWDNVGWYNREEWRLNIDPHLGESSNLAQFPFYRCSFLHSMINDSLDCSIRDESRTSIPPRALTRPVCWLHPREHLMQKNIYNSLYHTVLLGHPQPHKNKGNDKKKGIGWASIR